MSLSTVDRSIIIPRLLMPFYEYAQLNPSGRSIMNVGHLVLPNTMLWPDLSYYRMQQGAKRKLYVPYAPFAAAEVPLHITPLERVESRLPLYFAGGTEVVWVVLMDQQVVMDYRSNGYIYELGIDDALEGVKSMPGFTFPVAEIFNDDIP